MAQEIKLSFYHDLHDNEIKLAKIVGAKISSVLHKELVAIDGYDFSLSARGEEAIDATFKFSDNTSVKIVGKPHDGYVFMTYYYDALNNQRYLLSHSKYDHDLSDKYEVIKAVEEAMEELKEKKGFNNNPKAASGAKIGISKEPLFKSGETVWAKLGGENTPLLILESKQNKTASGWRNTYVVSPKNGSEIFSINQKQLASTEAELNEQSAKAFASGGKLAIKPIDLKFKFHIELLNEGQEMNYHEGFTGTIQEMITHSRTMISKVSDALKQGEFSVKVSDENYEQHWTVTETNVLDTTGNEIAEYAKGGYVNVEENLLKEIRKLQRDLNRRRLGTYMEGDTSEEAIARQRERAAKSRLFDEKLKELNEIVDNKKMEDGGMTMKQFQDGMRADAKAMSVAQWIKKYTADLTEMYNEEKGEYEYEGKGKFMPKGTFFTDQYFNYKQGLGYAKGGKLTKGLMTLKKFVETNAEKIIKHYLPDSNPNEGFQSSDLENVGDYLIYKDKDGDGSPEMLIEVYFGDKYDEANKEINENYKQFVSYIQDRADEQFLRSAEILTNDESQTVTFQFSDFTKH